MLELFQVAIAPPQILLTLLLALVVLYWLLVALGALDFDADLPDGLGEADLNAHQSHSGINTGGAWLTAGRFFGFSQVPIVVWLSFLVLFMWFGSLVLNQQWNPELSAARALWLLPPNLFASAIATKLATLPVGKLFKAMADADTEAEEIIGRTGTVVSVEVDDRYGQLEIPTKGAPLLLNVRTPAGAPSLKMGDAARVTAAGPESAYFFVDPS